MSTGLTIPTFGASLLHLAATDKVYYLNTFEGLEQKFQDICFNMIRWC